MSDAEVNEPAGSEPTVGETEKEKLPAITDFLSLQPYQSPVSCAIPLPRFSISANRMASITAGSHVNLVTISCLAFEY
jgi:hypothetical protein